METSKVPPPKSYTIMIPFLCVCKPYAIAAAVGSFNNLIKLILAKKAAFLTAIFCILLKYAGTVIIVESIS